MTLNDMADTSQAPIDPTSTPSVAEAHDAPPRDPPLLIEAVAAWPPPSVPDLTLRPSRRPQTRSVILAVVAAFLLTCVSALAVVARDQASGKLNAQRKLATASDQLNDAKRDLSRSSSDLATAQSSLGDTQSQVQVTEDALAQVKGVEVDTIAPFLVDESTTLDQARCIVSKVIDHLGVAQVLRYDSAPPSDPMPPELESAILQAASECVPGAPTA